MIKLFVVLVVMVQVTGRAVASHALRAYVPGKFTRSVLSILCIISAGVIGAVGVVCFIFCRSVIEHPIAIVVLDGWIYEIITKAK